MKKIANKCRKRHDYGIRRRSTYMLGFFFVLLCFFVTFISLFIYYLLFFLFEKQKFQQPLIEYTRVLEIFLPKLNYLLARSPCK